MTRRTLLGWLAALPGLGFLAAQKPLDPYLSVSDMRWVEYGPGNIISGSTSLCDLQYWDGTRWRRLSP